MSVKRYSLIGEMMFDMPKGNYVRHSDYERLVAVVRELVDECNHLHGNLIKHNHCVVPNTCRTAKKLTKALALLSDSGAEEWRG